MTPAVVIGHEKDWTEFGSRNEAFTSCLQRLNELIDLTFMRLLADAGFLDKVVFFLGNEAVEEFGEVLVLGGNGYGTGALKIVRGMFERMVTLSHLIRNPQDLNLWADFGDVNDHKLANASITALGQGAVSDEVMKEIERRYALVKKNYRVPVCKKCGTTKINHTWTRLDVVAMADKDEFLKAMVVEGYLEPMGQTHATRRSILARVTRLDNGGIGFNVGSSPDEADRAMCSAHKLLLYAIELNHKYFGMDNLELRNQCWADCNWAWKRLPKITAVQEEEKRG